MWRHIETTGPITDREGAEAMGEPAGCHNGAGREWMQPDQVHGGMAARGHRPRPHGGGVAGHDPAPGSGGQRLGYGGTGPVGSDPGGATAGTKSSEVACHVSCQGMAEPGTGRGPQTKNISTAQ